MEAPRQPWWRRKRWIAAGLLWLAFAYVFTAGPLTYWATRGQVPQPLADAILLPAAGAARLPLVGPPLDRYLRSSTVEALEDDGYVVEVRPNGDIAAAKTTVLIEPEPDYADEIRKAKAILEESRKRTTSPGTP